MPKKKKLIFIIGGILLVILAILYWYQSRPYSPGRDEIALRIQLDVREDFGLLVFDYEVDGKPRGGGISNADRSLIKHNEQLIQVWQRGREDLDTEADSVELKIRFRIITEYVDPNFENVYPEEISRYLEPVSLKAEFGKMYDLTITGDKDAGYKVVLP